MISLFYFIVIMFSFASLNVIARNTLVSADFNYFLFEYLNFNIYFQIMIDK